MIVLPALQGRKRGRGLLNDTVGRQLFQCLPSLFGEGTQIHIFFSAAGKEIQEGCLFHEQGQHMLLGTILRLDREGQFFPAPECIGRL